MKTGSIDVRRGRKGLADVVIGILGVLIIAAAIGLLIFLWFLFNSPIELYATTEVAETKFIRAIHVLEEARLFIKKSTEYALQLSVIEVSDQGGLIPVSNRFRRDSGGPYLTLLSDEDVFPDVCPDQDRKFELIINPNSIQGPVEPLVNTVLDQIRASVPESLNEYADLFTEYEVSNNVNVSVFDKLAGEDGFKLSCISASSIDSSLESIAETGTAWVKVPIKWREIQPTQSGNFDWTKVDAFYFEAEERGLEVIPVFGWAPDWAVPEADRSLAPTRNIAPSPAYHQAFADFTGEYVSHLVSEGYSVNYATIWQFPNSGGSWSGDGIETVDFARMFKLASLKLREKNPSIKIIFPALLSTPTCGYDRYPSDPKAFSGYFDTNQNCASVDCIRHNCQGLRYVERCGTGYLTHENIECLPTLDVDCTRPDAYDQIGEPLCKSHDYWNPYMYDSTMRPENYSRMRYFSLSDIDFLTEMYYHDLGDYFDIFEFNAVGTELPQEEFDNCITSSPSSCRGFGRIKLFQSLLFSQGESDKEIFVNIDFSSVTPESKRRTFASNVFTLSERGELKTGPICVPESLSSVVANRGKDETFSPWGDLYVAANHTTKVATIKRANQEVFFTGFGLVSSDDNSTGKLGFSMTEILKEARAVAKNPERAIMASNISCSSSEKSCAAGFFKRSDSEACTLGNYECPESTASGPVDCEAKLSVPYRMTCEFKTQVYNYTCAVDSVEYPGTELDPDEIRPNSCYEDSKSGGMGICVSASEIVCTDMNPFAIEKGQNNFKWCRNVDDICCQWGYVSGTHDPYDEEKDYSIASASGTTCLCVRPDQIASPEAREQLAREIEDLIGDDSGLTIEGYPYTSTPGPYYVQCSTGSSGDLPADKCCEGSTGELSACNWWLGGDGWSAEDLDNPQLGVNYEDGSAYYAGCRNHPDGQIEICYKGASMGTLPPAEVCMGGIFLPETEAYYSRCISTGETHCEKNENPNSRYCLNGWDVDPTEDICWEPAQPCNYPDTISGGCCMSHSAGRCLPFSISPVAHPGTVKWHYDCHPDNTAFHEPEDKHVPCGDRSNDARGLCVDDAQFPDGPWGKDYQIPNYKKDWTFEFLKPGVDYDKKWWQDLNEVEYEGSVALDGPLLNGQSTTLLKVAAQDEYDKLVTAAGAMMRILYRAGIIDGTYPGAIHKEGTIPAEFFMGIIAAESAFDKCAVGLDGGVGLMAIQLFQMMNDYSSWSPPPPNFGTTTIDSFFTTETDVPGGTWNETVPPSGGCSEDVTDDATINGSYSGVGIDSAYWRDPPTNIAIGIGIIKGYSAATTNCPGYLAYLASGHNTGRQYLSCTDKLTFFATSPAPRVNPDPAPFNKYPAKVLALTRIFEEAFDRFKDAGPGAEAIIEVLEEGEQGIGRPWGSANNQNLAVPYNFHRVEINTDEIDLNTCAHDPDVKRTCWFAPPFPTLNRAHTAEQKQKDVKLSYFDCNVTISNARWALSSLLRESPGDSATLEGVPNEFKFGLQFAYANRDCERGIAAGGTIDDDDPALAKDFPQCRFTLLPEFDEWSIDPPALGSSKYWHNTYTPNGDFGTSSGIFNYIPGCCGYSKAEEVLGTITFTSDIVPEDENNAPPPSTPGSGAQPNPGPYCNPVPGGSASAEGSIYCTPFDRGWGPYEHRAVDLYTSEGTQILATQSGTVIGFRDDMTGTVSFLRGATPAEIASACGSVTVDFSKYTADNAFPQNYLAIDHGDGKTSSYWHLQPHSIPDHLKRVGARVERGEVIALVGTQGQANCPHLHFTVEGTPGAGDTTCESVAPPGSVCCFGDMGRGNTINPTPYLSVDCGTNGAYVAPSTTGKIINGDDARCGGNWLGGKYTEVSSAPRGPGGTGVYVNPAPGAYCTQEYCNAGTHDGIDLGAPDGTPLYAPTAGTVIEANDIYNCNCCASSLCNTAGYSSCSGCGLGTWGICGSTSNNTLVIEHDGDDLSSRFYHIKQGSLLVHAGDHVEAGDPVAQLGNQGCSTGPHLHWELFGTPGADDVTCDDYSMSGQACCTARGSTTVDPATKIDYMSCTLSGGT